MIPLPYNVFIYSIEVHPGVDYRRPTFVPGFSAKMVPGWRKMRPLGGRYAPKNKKEVNVQAIWESRHWSCILTLGSILGSILDSFWELKSLKHQTKKSRIFWRGFWMESGGQTGATMEPNNNLRINDNFTIFGRIFGWIFIAKQPLCLKLVGFILSRCFDQTSMWIFAPRASESTKFNVWEDQRKHQNRNKKYSTVYSIV